MKKALGALAFGAFGFSMSEYAMVGILTKAARGLHVEIAFAGHFLSAYALGVVAGALAWATLCRNQPPKKMLYSASGRMPWPRCAVTNRPRKCLSGW